MNCSPPSTELQCERLCLEICIGHKATFWKQLQPNSVSLDGVIAAQTAYLARQARSHLNHTLTECGLHPLKVDKSKQSYSYRLTNRTREIDNGITEYVRFEFVQVKPNKPTPDNRMQAIGLIDPPTIREAQLVDLLSKLGIGDSLIMKLRLSIPHIDCSLHCVAATRTSAEQWAWFDPFVNSQAVITSWLLLQMAMVSIRVFSVRT